MTYADWPFYVIYLTYNVFFMLYLILYIYILVYLYTPLRLTSWPLTLGKGVCWRSLEYSTLRALQ
jgi:hypothetical protein